MEKRIAIPVSNGELDGHFGHCSQFALVDVSEQKIKEITYIDAPPHQLRNQPLQGRTVVSCLFIASASIGVTGGIG